MQITQHNTHTEAVVRESQQALPEKAVLQLDYVDGVRGILTVAILLAHVRTTLIYVPLHTVNFALFAASTVWLWPAFYVVGMFIAMSGYCLMLPVARSRDGRFRGGVPDYLSRRARRMLPPYYVALLLYLAATLVAHNPYMQAQKAFPPGSLWSHLFLVHNLSAANRYSIDAPCWTVASEWQLYLLFPLVLLPIWRRFGCVGLLLVSAALGFLPTLCGGDVTNWHTWYIFLFAVGMCGASIQFYDRPQENRWRERIPWGKLTLGLWGVFGLLCTVDLLLHRQLRFIYLPTWKRMCFYETLAGSACLALIVYANQRRGAASEARRAFVRKLLTPPAFTAIGMFSYSHYLVHFPILISIRHLTQLWNLPASQVIFVMYGIAIPVSLAGGYLFFLMVERWFLPSHLKKKSA